MWQVAASTASLECPKSRIVANTCFDRTAARLQPVNERERDPRREGDQGAMSASEKCATQGTAGRVDTAHPGVVCLCLDSPRVCGAVRLAFVCRLADWASCFSIGRACYI